MGEHLEDIGPFLKSDTRNMTEYTEGTFRAEGNSWPIANKTMGPWSYMHKEINYATT